MTESEILQQINNEVSTVNALLIDLITLLQQQLEETQID